jgi:hypothetical protein
MRVERELNRLLQLSVREAICLCLRGEPSHDREIVGVLGYLDRGLGFSVNRKSESIRV